MAGCRIDELRSILAAHALLFEEEPVGPGASDEAIKSAESALGCALPAERRALYGLCDGAYLVGGNLTIYPIEDDGDLCLMRATDYLRESGWRLPDELLVFGDDGMGGSLAVWQGDRTEARSSVVHIGEPGKDACLALAGTSLTALMRGWLAYYAMLMEEEPGGARAALEALGVPESLWSDDPEDEVLSALRSWADPALLDADADPYDNGKTAEEMCELIDALQWNDPASAEPRTGAPWWSRIGLGALFMVAGWAA